MDTRQIVPDAEPYWVESQGGMWHIEQHFEHGGNVRTLCGRSMWYVRKFDRWVEPERPCNLCLARYATAHAARQTEPQRARE